MFLALTFVVSASATANDQNSAVKTGAKFGLAALGDTICVAGLTILEGKPISNAAYNSVDKPLYSNNFSDSSGNPALSYMEERNGKFIVANDNGVGNGIFTRDEMIEKVGLDTVKALENTAKYNRLVNRYGLILLAANAGICSGVAWEALRNHGTVIQDKTVNVVGDSVPQSLPATRANPIN